MQQDQVCLDRLLPIHAARERGAQQQLHESTRLHQRAVLMRQGVQAELNALGVAARQALAYALDGAAANARDAQAALDQVHLIQAQVPAAQAKVASAQAEVDQALAAVDEARRRYAKQVRTGHKMQQASDRQNAERRARSAEHKARLMDDEFVPGWLARQQTETAA